MSKPQTLNAQAAASSLSKGWRPQLRASLLAMLSVGALGIAHAESLVDLYVAAKAYDAAYLSAKAQSESVQYQVEQAYAAHRPQVGAKASVTRAHFDAANGMNPRTEELYKSVGIPTKVDSTSTTKSVGLTAKQPLFNRENDVKIAQAEQSIKIAQADLAIAESDLIARLTQSYFDVLAAQDVLTTTQTNKKALSEQLASAKRNFEVGNATITDTREAQARFDLATAQEIAATNDLRVKHIALDQLVGRAEVKPAPLLIPAKLDSLAPGQMEDWVTKTAEAPTVRKAEVLLAGAKLEIDKARAQNLPTLDAVGGVSRSSVDSSNSSSKSSAGTTASVGLELNYPIYVGGAVQNKIKEALFQHEKAEHDVENARRTVALGTRQTFSGVQSGLAQLKALEAAEGSAKLALEATQMGYKVGVRINKDVLDAQTALANTQKDLYKARYDVIVGTIKLKQAAGTLRAEDLEDLNKMLAQN